MYCYSGNMTTMEIQEDQLINRKMQFEHVGMGCGLDIAYDNALPRGNGLYVAVA